MYYGEVTLLDLISFILHFNILVYAGNPISKEKREKIN